MAISYTNEYLFWDNTEAVTVHVGVAGGADLAITVSQALRDGLDSRRQTFAGVAISGGEVFWSIPGTLVTPSVIGPGDSIVVSDTEKYTVLAVNEVRVGSSLSHYECMTVKQR